MPRVGIGGVRGIEAHDLDASARRRGVVGLGPHPFDPLRGVVRRDGWLDPLDEDRHTTSEVVDVSIRNPVAPQDLVEAGSFDHEGARGMGVLAGSLERDRAHDVELVAELLDHGSHHRGGDGVVVARPGWIADLDREARRLEVGGGLADGQDLRLGEFGERAVVGVASDFPQAILHVGAGQQAPRAVGPLAGGHRQADTAAELRLQHVTAGREEDDQAQHRRHDAARHEDASPANPVDARFEQTVDRRHDGRQHGQRLRLQDLDVEVEDRPCGEERREQRGEHADRKRQREALHLGRGGLIEHEADDQVGDVAVEDGAQRLSEAQTDRIPQLLAVVDDLLADPLVDQHVGVDRHADRQGDASEPRQREGSVDHRHHPEDDDAVEQQRDVGDQTGEEVVPQHDHGHHDHRERDRLETDDEILLADRGAQHVDRDRLRAESGLEGACGKHADQVVDLLVAEAAGDLAVARDPTVQGRGPVDLAVEDDRHRLSDRGAGEASELGRTALIHREGDRGPPEFVPGPAGAADRPRSFAAVGEALLRRGVQQQVVAAVPFRGGEAASGEERRRIGLERRQLLVVGVPLLQVVDLEPAGHQAVGVAGAALRELLPHQIDVDAFGRLVVDGDAELEDACATQEALQVLRVVEAGALRRVGVVRLDEGIEPLPLTGVLRRESQQGFGPRRRIPHHVAVGTRHRIALGIEAHRPLGFQGEDPEDSGFGKRTQHPGPKSIESDLRVDDPIFDRRDRLRIRLIDGGLLQLEASLPDRIVLDLKALQRGGIGEAGEACGEGPREQRRVQFAGTDVGAVEQVGETVSEGGLQLPDRRVRQGHDHFDAIAALRLHRDVEHAAGVDPLLEHVDHLRQHLVAGGAFRNPDRIGEAHAAAQILAEADLPLDGEDLQEADGGDRDDQGELEGKLGHVDGLGGRRCRRRVTLRCPTPP